MDIDELTAALGDCQSIEWSNPATLHPRLSKRIVEVGDCWEWVGNYSNAGRMPAMRLNYKLVGVRRVIQILKSGRPIGANRIMLTCGNFRCVNPEHYKVMGYGTYLRIVQQKGNEANRARPYKPNAGNVKRRKLTPEQVSCVRGCDASSRVLARELGVSHATITAIRRGEKYKEVGRMNMWSQLVRKQL